MTSLSAASYQAVQDFSAYLAGMVIFSEVELVRGYHQVPVHPLDVPITAVITPFGLSSCECRLALKTQLNLFNASWTLGAAFSFCELG